MASLNKHTASSGEFEEKFLQGSTIQDVYTKH